MSIPHRVFLVMAMLWVSYGTSAADQSEVLPLGTQERGLESVLERDGVQWLEYKGDTFRLATSNGAPFFPTTVCENQLVTVYFAGRTKHTITCTQTRVAITCEIYESDPFPFEDDLVASQTVEFTSDDSVFPFEVDYEFTFASLDLTPFIASELDDCGEFYLKLVTDCLQSDEKTANESVCLTAGTVPGTPTITGLPSTVCGGATYPLTAIASGSPIGWNWGSECQGSFSAPGNSSTNWTAPLGYTGACEITVAAVSAGCGSVTGSAFTTIQQDLSAPVINNLPDTVCGGVSYSISASVTGDAESWSWSSSFGGSFVPPNGSITTWTAPTGFSANCLITVTASSSACGSTPGYRYTAVRQMPGVPSITGLPEEVCGGTAYPISAFATGSPTYWNWQADCGGSFNPPDSRFTSWTPPTGYVGACEITATASNFCGSTAATRTTAVSETPGIPMNLTASPSNPCSGTELEISWTAVTGAQGYDVFVNGFLSISPAENSVLLYVDPGIQEFSVRAASGLCYSPQSPPLMIDVEESLPPPTIEPVYSACYGQQVCMDWAPVPGANSYRVSENAGPDVDVGLSTEYCFTPAVAGANSIDVVAVGECSSEPSREWVYVLEEVAAGTITVDNGAFVDSAWLVCDQFLSVTFLEDQGANLSSVRLLYLPLSEEDRGQDYERPTPNNGFLTPVGGGQWQPLSPFSIAHLPDGLYRLRVHRTTASGQVSEDCNADGWIDDFSFDLTNPTHTLLLIDRNPFGECCNCPPDMVVNADFGSLGESVEFNDHFAEACPDISIVCTPQSGSFFPIGTTEVTCIGVATDGLEQDTCRFDVVVSQTGDYVAIPNVIAAPGQAGVRVPIRISNTAALKSVTLPVMIREVTSGAFITSCRTGFSERLASSGGPLSDVVVTNQYDHNPGTCGNEETGGFGSPLFSDTLSHLITSSPWGAMWIRSALLGETLQPGTDSVGSLELVVTVSTTPGYFEIDTTCTDPSNHITFVDYTNLAFTPQFVKGLVQVGQPVHPTAVCQSIQLDSDGNCEVAFVEPTQFDDGSTEPSGMPLTFQVEPPGPYGLGETEVAFIVTNELGLADTCPTTITVVDSSPPVISCPLDTTILIGPEDSSVVVEFEVTVVDNCVATCGDIVWVVDRSGSMGDDQAAISANASNVFSGLSAGDFRVGVLAFGGSTCISASNPVSVYGTPYVGAVGNGQFTASADTFAVMVAGAGTQADVGFELGLTALSDAIKWYPFREECRKILVLVTDEDSDDLGCFPDVSPDTIMGQLFESGVQIHTILNVADSQGYSSLAPATDGEVYSILGDWGVNIAELVSNIYVSVETAPPSGSSFGIGSTQVWSRVADPSGNIDSCSFTVTVARGCSCSSQGDIDASGDIDAVDLQHCIDVVFFGGENHQDVGCPVSRSDFDNNGFPDVTDIQFMIDYIFFGGAEPLNPCR